MDYNANTLLYEYSLDFFDIGTFEYSVNCSHDNFSELDAADTFTILPPEGSKLPSGAQVDVIKSERANLTQNPDSNEAQAGNVTQLDIFSNTITRSWQGYYGNVSGAISLGDLDGNVLYNWSAVNPTGQVYATRAFDVNFATTKCANELEISSEEEFIGHNSSDADSVTNTFNQNNHPHFSVGLINIDENSCKSTNLFDENGNQITKFFNTLLSDGASNIIYSSILEQSERGFDGRNHDFQLIVGENGRDELTTNYYFYVEVI